MGKNLNVAGKNNDSVLTPESIWGPWARAVEGLTRHGFTLDPCGCRGQDGTADDIIVTPDDGLLYNWDGHNVWLNPPYSQLQYPQKYPWLQLAAEESDITIAFIPARTSAPWFRDALALAHQVWFLDYRVVHKNAPLSQKTGAPMSAPFAQCFLQFGQDDRILPVPQEFTGWGIRFGERIEYSVRAREKKG